MKKQKSKQHRDVKKINLFPRGETPVFGVFALVFSENNAGKKSAIGRYLLKSEKIHDFQDFEKQIEKHLKKNISFVPGIRSAFIRPDNGPLEFAVAVDYGKAKSFLDAAQGQKYMSKNVLSLEHIKMMLKSQMKLLGVSI